MDFLLNLFVPVAHAAEGAAPQEPSMMPTLVMLGVFGLIFYFMLFRPQAKRAKEHKAMLEAIAKGDEVVTSGGVMGKVAKVAEAHIEVTVADGVDLKIQKHAIVAVLPKGSLKSN